jgi:uracil-DNA glycosylase
MALTKEQQLEQIRADIEKSNICPDLAKTAKHLVFGYGNPDAELVFIGEAPGKHEDEKGLPFVGASGEYLNSLLADIGLSREQVYITNIVKYRPPENRDPRQSEKEAFLPYLLNQLEIIKPNIIVTLGRHSMNCFLPNYVIGDVHGKIQQVGALQILPLYHPAAALYNGKLRDTLRADFNQIPGLLKSIRKEM